MVLVAPECAAPYSEPRNRGLAFLVFDYLCHTFYDYKPLADLAVGIRAKNLKRKTLYRTKRGLHYA